jgi:hypothetical protein
MVIDRRDHDENVALFKDFSQKIGQNQKSAIVTPQTVSLWGDDRPDLRVANNNNQYLKWKYCWARGQKTVLAKILSSTEYIAEKWMGLVYSHWIGGIHY